MTAKLKAWRGRKERGGKERKTEKEKQLLSRTEKKEKNTDTIFLFLEGKINIGAESGHARDSVCRSIQARTIDRLIDDG